MYIGPTVLVLGEYAPGPGDETLVLPKELLLDCSMLQHKRFDGFRLILVRMKVPLRESMLSRE